jgi:protoporphyrinogen oxidase
MKRYDKVYTTIGAHDLRPLVLGKLKTLQEFESVSIMAVNLWFPQPNLKPPGFGYLIPRSVSEERNPHHALGVFFDSDIGNNHPDEPEGTKLFVLMGGHHYEKPGVSVPTPDEAVQQARELLEQHLGIPQSLPCHAEARFSHNCIPQHNVGHMQRVADLLHQLEDEFEGRLVPTGGSFTRIGGMAALGDGFHAGTTGLDPSKPQAVATWEALVGPITGGHMNLSPLWNDALTGVRPALFTPIKGAPIPRVSLSPDGENVLFTYPHETGKYPVGVSGKTNSSQ